MRKLAGQVGLSVTTLYNQFGSREELLAALVHDLVDMIDGALDIEAGLDEPLERCRAIVSVSIDYIVRHESVCRPMFVAIYQGLTDVPPDRFGTPERAAGMQTEAIEAAVERGLLNDTLAADVVGQQIYHGYEMSATLWARGLCDAAEFEARALYGVYVALLAIATDQTRPMLAARAAELEPALRAAAAARTTEQERSA